jgi:hypothetical protein
MTISVIRTVELNNFEPLYKSFSLYLKTIVKDNENIIAINKGDTRAFTPNQLQDLIDWLTNNVDEEYKVDILNLVGCIWTQEVIDNYNNSMES